VVLKFNAHLVKCRLKYGLCNPPVDNNAHTKGYTQNKHSKSPSLQ